ncbi:MAG: M23 family metallopeptidase [Bacteroidales bacterium]|nr:M23 family metallopeptidase [Bacteroidales bacterium]
MDKPEKKKKNRAFRLALVDAVSHERIWSFRYTRTAMIVAIVSAAVIIVLGIYCLIAFTPIRSFIPGYPGAISRRQAVQNALRIDSLETRIMQWELYAENLRRVVSGADPIRMDSLILKNRDATREEVDARFLALRDSLLRADVEQEEQFGIDATVSRRNLPIEALSFFTPVKGVVSDRFDRALHPYIDITAPAGSMVMSVLDGTVVYTGWEEEDGYILAIQHSGDILTIYKHNEKLLRKAGETVKAGTPVGVLAASSSLTKGDHLHFELWYEGVATDPTQYIKF